MTANHHDGEPYFKPCMLFHDNIAKLCHFCVLGLHSTTQVVNGLHATVLAKSCLVLV